MGNLLLRNSLSVRQLSFPIPEEEEEEEKREEKKTCPSHSSSIHKGDDSNLTPPERSSPSSSLFPTQGSIYEVSAPMSTEVDSSSGVRQTKKQLSARGPPISARLKATSCLSKKQLTFHPFYNRHLTKQEGGREGGRKNEPRTPAEETVKWIVAIRTRTGSAPPSPLRPPVAPYQ